MDLFGTFHLAEELGKPSSMHSDLILLLLLLLFQQCAKLLH